MKKNYVVLDVNGIIKKQYIANLVATSADVDVIYILADFDKASSESAYRCYARVQRPDGFIVGPVNMPTGIITQEEADELGVDYLNCRMLTLSSTMMALEGTIQVTIVYDQLDIYGKVISTMATGKVVANVNDAVETILTEEEIAELKAQFLPRDLSEVTLADNLDDASLVLGQQDGITKRIGMALVKEYIQYSTIINLGTIASASELDIIQTTGLYRFVLANVIHLMLVSNDEEKVYQTTFDTANIKTRSFDGVTWTSWEYISFETLRNDIADIKTNLSTLNAFKDETVPNTYATKTALNNHVGATGNPHNMQKSDLGLDKVENKSSADIRGEIVEANIPTIPQSKVTDLGTDLGNRYTKTEADNLLLNKADLVDGKVPASQLPSFVDDVLEYDSLSLFPATGESGKIYVDKATNKTYRWGGTSYVVISETLALGETAQSAYYGDKGKIAYDHSQVAHDKALVGLSNVDNTSDTDKPISTAQQNEFDKKVDKDFSTYEDGTIEDTDLILLNKGGLPKKNTIAGLAAKISAETGTFVPTADYSAQGLGAAKAVKDGDGLVIKDTYLKKGTSVLNVNDVKTHILDSNPINETVKLTSVNGWTEIIGNVIKNSNPKLIISKSNNLFDINSSSTPTNATKTIITNGIKVKTITSNTFTRITYSYTLKPSVQYTLKTNSNIISGASWVRIATSGNTTLKEGENGTLTFTTPSDGVILISFYATMATSALGEVEYTNIQLNEGTTALPYQPYARHEIALPDLSVQFPNGLGRLPNGVYDSVDSKKIGYTKYVGTENWQFHSEGNNHLRFDLSIAINYSGDTTKINSDAKSNIFLQDMLVAPALYTERFWLLGGGTGLRVVSTYDRLLPYGLVIGNTSTYISAFKSYLTSNNLELIYQLATPIPTGITLPSVPTYDRGHIEIDEGRMSLEIPVDITAQTNVNTKNIYDIQQTDKANKTLLDATIVDVNTNKDKIATIEGDITTINNEIDGIDTEIVSAKSRLDNIEEDLSSKENLRITDTFVVNSSAAMLALNCQTGDVCVRTDLKKSFILKGTDPSNVAHWQELLTPTDSVLSVNDKTGTVSLTQDDIPSGDTNKVFMASEKTKLGTIADNAQVNVIEEVKVNGTALPVVNKAVDYKLFDVLLTSANGVPVNSAYNAILTNVDNFNLYKTFEIEWALTSNSSKVHISKVGKNTANGIAIGLETIISDIILYQSGPSDFLYYHLAISFGYKNEGDSYGHQLMMGRVKVGASLASLGDYTIYVRSIKGYYY